MLMEYILQMYVNIHSDKECDTISLTYTHASWSSDNWDAAMEPSPVTAISWLNLEFELARRTDGLSNSTICK